MMLMNDPFEMRRLSTMMQDAAEDHEALVNAGAVRYMTDPAYHRRVRLVADDLLRHTRLPLMRSSDDYEIFQRMALRAVVAIDALGMYPYAGAEMTKQSDAAYFATRDMRMLAAGWDAAVAAMRYEDGTPVEIVTMVNPYRPHGKVELDGERS